MKEKQVTENITPQRCFNSEQQNLQGRQEEEEKKRKRRWRGKKTEQQKR